MTTAFTPIAADALAAIIEKHGMWLRGEEGGARANLSGAYLSGADLSGADLRRADLRRADLSGADLSGADLSGADLSGAYLSGADLSGADLSGADLRRADLSGAYLSGADLRRAYLSGADLSGADLSGADLSGAYLSGAYLSGADLSGADLNEFYAKLETARLGEEYTFGEYWRQFVPALLTAGGRALDEIANPTVWGCHTWSNCPMAEAFGVHELEQVPILHRPAARQFVSLFDAKLIPLDRVNPAMAEGSAATCAVPTQEDA